MGEGGGEAVAGEGGGGDGGGGEGGGGEGGGSWAHAVAAALACVPLAHNTSLVRPASVAAVPTVPAGQIKLAVLPAQVVPLSVLKMLVADAKKKPGADWHAVAAALGCIPVPQTTSPVRPATVAAEP